MHKDRKLQKQRTKSEGDLRDVIAQLSPRGSSVGPARPPSVFESAATSLKLRAHRERVLWTPTANALRLRAASSSHDVAPLVSRRTQSLVNVGPPDPLWADRRALSNPVSRHASIPSMVFSDFNQDANSPRVATPPSGPSTVAGSAASSPLVTRTPPRLGQSAPGSDVGSSPASASTRRSRASARRAAASAARPSRASCPPTGCAAAAASRFPSSHPTRTMAPSPRRWPARRPRRLRLRRRRLAAVVGVVARRRLAAGLGVVVRGRSRRAASDAGAPEDVATKADRNV